MMGSARKRLLAAACVVAMSLPLAACGDDSDSGSDASSGGGTKVGLLLPENQTARYEQFDHPVFEKTLAEQCPDCDFVYANAGNDAQKQQSQAESMLAQGVKVLVLFPVDGAAAATIVSNAKSRGVTVIGYGRTPSGPLDYTVSFSDQALGEANGAALKSALDASGAQGDIVWINGDKTTPNTDPIAAAAKEALGSEWTIGREYYTKGWDPAEAQKEMDQAITALGADKIAGVFSMNDGMASGAIAAMKAAGMDPLPPITGMDAELAAVQRIIVGEQVASVYPSPINIATMAAQTAAAVAQGEKPQTQGTLNNGTGDIPLVQPEMPAPITIDNIQSALIDAGVYTYDEICTADYKSACDEAGLKPAA